MRLCAGDVGVVGRCRQARLADLSEHDLSAGDVPELHRPQDVVRIGQRQRD